MIKLPLKTFKGMEVEKHYIHEIGMRFDEFLQEGNGFSIGDKVKIENSKECVFPMSEDVFCLTFDKGKLFIEEPFTLQECKVLFGEDFDY